jgi:hypothetical protein
MARHEAGIITQSQTDRQRSLRPPKQSNREEALLRVFAIVVLLLGLLAMIILHVRTALPATLSDVSAVQNAAPAGTQDAVEWLAWKLNLSRTQQQQVRPVVEQEIRARAALLGTAEVSESEQRAQLLELRNRALEEIRPVLTNQQQAILTHLEREG